MTDYEKLVESLKAELGPTTEKLEDFFKMIGAQYEDMLAEFEAAIDEEVGAKAAETAEGKDGTTAIDVVGLFDFEPDLGHGGEPSLRDLLFQYYAPHFPERVARAYTEEYIEKVHGYLESVGY